jgi:hypothetical protein
MIDKITNSTEAVQNANGTFSPKLEASNEFKPFSFTYHRKTPILSHGEIDKNFIGWLYDFVDGETYNIWWDPLELSGVISGNFIVTLKSDTNTSPTYHEIYIKPSHIEKLKKLRIEWVIL